MVSLARRFFAEWLGTMLLVATVVGSGIMAEQLAGGNVALALLGAHFNPAVSFAFALRREISVRIALAYTGWQIFGGICGTVLAHAMFEAPLLQLSTHMRSGLAQYGSEFVATFGLVAVIFGGVRYVQTAVPWLVGLYITAAYWFTASTSFANPAVTIARVLTDSFSGIFPGDMPFFIIAQIAAAAAASIVCGWLFAEDTDK